MNLSFLSLRRLPWIFSLGIAVSTLTSCSQTGPTKIQSARFDYNEAIVRSFDYQLLLNLVRLRYQDSILFLDLTSVVTSYERETTVNANASLETGAALLGGGSLGGERRYLESPTITYSPLQGEDFAKRLLAPIQPNAILLLSRSGWGLERLLLCTVQQVNDVPNGTAVGGIAPRRVHHFRSFRRLAYLLRVLQEEGHIQFITSAAQPDLAFIKAGPIPMTPEANRLVDEALSLLRTTSEPPPDAPLAFRSSPAAANASESSKEAVAPPQEQESVPKPEAGDGATSATPKVPATGHANEGTTVRVLGRSILGVLTYLAQNVDIPEEHRRDKLVNVTLDADGKPFDWSELSGNLFHVRTSKNEPEISYLKVFYRGYWFYIEDTDLESKGTYALVSQLFSLQAADSGGQAPLLTIPTR